MAPIYEEISELGIVPEDFNKVYSYLNEKKQLPLGDVVSLEKYARIVDYLQSKGVLGRDNQIQEEGLKIFDGKLRLEQKVKMTEELPDPDIRSSGGIAPCREEESTLRSSGGVAPCRD